MRIGIIGINHKQAHVTLRENIAAACHHTFSQAPMSALSCSFVILSTCNRVEVYFSAPNLADIHQKIIDRLRIHLIDEFEQKLYSFFGRDCFLHLAKVTSGLDSLIIGETEIKGQVAKAYATAKQERTLAKELHFLFQKSLQIAKAVRAKILTHNHLPGIEHAIWKQIETFFPNTTPKTLIVGASMINMRTLHYLVRKLPPHLIWLTNRTHEKALSLAQEVGIEVFPWDKLQEHWHTFDLVVSGAKSPNYLIAPTQQTTHQNSKKLLIDLGVPRNIDPEISLARNISLLNIDSLKPSTEIHKETEQRILFEATQMTCEEAVKKCLLYQKKAVNCTAHTL